MNIWCCITVKMTSNKHTQRLLALQHLWVQMQLTLHCLFVDHLIILACPTMSIRPYFMVERCDLPELEMVVSSEAGT